MYVSHACNNSWFLCVVIVGTGSSEATSSIDQQIWYVCIMYYYDMHAHIYALHLNELKSIQASNINCIIQNIFTTTTTATLLLLQHTHLYVSTQHHKLCIHRYTVLFCFISGYFMMSITTEIKFAVYSVKFWWGKLY